MKSGPSRIHLVDLHPDHPGFSDAAYRARRDAIASIALAHRFGEPVADAPYTEDEHGIWQLIAERLGPLHGVHACREVVHMGETFPLEVERIPQLAAVNRRLDAVTGFHMEPVAGLVVPRDFLEALADGVFLSTQYIRHHSRPWYTPEPDVVHELVGHGASLAHPGIADLSRVFGAAAMSASDEEIERLIRVYWFTLEFGLAAEGDQVKVYGAGLLSSVGEIQSCVTDARLHEWDLDRIAVMPYDPTDMQPDLFVAPSFDGMLLDVTRWVIEGAWRDR